MKYLILILLHLLVCCSGKRQDVEHCQTHLDTFLKKDVARYVDEMPRYKDSDEDFIKYVYENLELSKDDSQRTFSLVFIVDDDGSVKAARIAGKEENEVTPAERNIIEMLEKMPAWHPGRCNGKAVPVVVEFPLRIQTM